MYKRQTLPRELSYRNGELCQLPVRELEKSLCIHKISEQERQSGEIILKNRVYCAKPVSYTHLDVYKRQIFMEIIRIHL